MADAELIETRNVALEDIQIGSRIRPFSEHGVAAAMQSIEQVGALLAPVMLRRNRGKLHLIAGMHRVEASRRLGRETVRAEIWKCSADWARLAEIDDNLAVSDLSVLELAQFLAERQRVHERLHPETRHGGDRRSAEFVARQDQKDMESVGSAVADDDPNALSFAATIAQQRGISERHVRRLSSIGRRIAPSRLAQIADLGLQPTIRELIDYSNTTPDIQEATLDALKTQSATSVKAALKSVAPSAPAEDPTDPLEAFAKDMLGKYRRADKAARLRFLQTLWDRYADELAEARPAIQEDDT